MLGQVSLMTLIIPRSATITASTFIRPCLTYLHKVGLEISNILSTSFAFILGCLPLAVAAGPGAGARVSMGNAVVGGMTIATGFGIFLIPVLFVVVEQFFRRK